MKKLKEIPFNHELIGKEGIEVKYRNGLKVLEVHYFNQTTNKDCILSTCERKHLWSHKITGQYTDTDNPLDLIMYQEIEVKEPRVIWVNIYPNNAIYIHHSKENAFSDLMPSGKTVKFIEVIEEGE